MVRNEELAKQFVAGATTGRGNNIFIDGDAIYSYGSHFPIALRTPAGYIVNKSKYSVTTSKHQGYVKRAIGESGQKIIKELDTNQLIDAVYKHHERTGLFKEDNSSVKKKRARIQFG